MDDSMTSQHDSLSFVWAIQRTADANDYRISQNSKSRYFHEPEFGSEAVLAALDDRNQ